MPMINRTVEIEPSFFDCRLLCLNRRFHHRLIGCIIHLLDAVNACAANP